MRQASCEILYFGQDTTSDKKTKKERYSAAEKLRVYFNTVKDISAATVENNIALVSITPPND